MSEESETAGSTEFAESLGALLRSAYGSDVTIEGGWDFPAAGDEPSWTVEISRVVDRRREEGPPSSD